MACVSFLLESELRVEDTQEKVKALESVIYCFWLPLAARFVCVCLRVRDLKPTLSYPADGKALGSPAL